MYMYTVVSLATAMHRLILRAGRSPSNPASCSLPCDNRMINDGYIISQMSTIPNRIVTLPDKSVFNYLTLHDMHTYTIRDYIARNWNMHRLATIITLWDATIPQTSWRYIYT